MDKLTLLASVLKLSIMSHLTVSQRYTICVMKKQGYKQIEIAKAIDRDKSVVSRELKRNRDKRSGVYNDELAERKCKKRHQEKLKRIHFTAAIKTKVEVLLNEQYSPEQIAGYLKKEHITCVSTERIYQHIWTDKEKHGVLYKQLRTRGKRYRKRGSLKDKRGIIKNRIPIEKRPAIVELKERFGDLEIDTIIGQNHKGAIVTINDRATGMLRMKKIKTKEASLVKNATLELLNEWKPLLHTITADNGKEFALHQTISKNLNIDFFFATPYHSWERGANENLNGLIRQYIPKKSDFSLLSDDYIVEIQEKLNNRPRKRFNFESPNFIFNQKVAFMT